EIVVRAAAASAIPLISAVGHETDTTLIDFAADRRAPTPTAAAEMAVPVRIELIADVMRDGQRLVAALHRMVEERRLRVEGLGRGLGDPARLIGENRQRLDDKSERLAVSLCNWVAARRGQVEGLAARVIGSRAAILRTVEQCRDRSEELLQRAHTAVARVWTDRVRQLESRAQLLESFSYQRVLERGFVLVHDAAGHAVISAADAREAGQVALRFHDGEVGA